MQLLSRRASPESRRDMWRLLGVFSAFTCCGCCLGMCAPTPACYAPAYSFSLAHLCSVSSVANMLNAASDYKSIRDRCANHTAAGTTLQPTCNNSLSRLSQQPVPPQFRLTRRTQVAHNVKWQAVIPLPLLCDTSFPTFHARCCRCTIPSMRPNFGF